MVTPPQDLRDTLPRSDATSLPPHTAADEVVRAPVPPPEASDASVPIYDPQRGKTHEHPKAATPLSNFLRHETHLIGHEFTDARHATIRSMPNVLVNHSVKFGAGVHLLAEMAMFRASSARAKRPWVTDEEKHNLLNYVIKPIQRIGDDIHKGIRSHDVDFKELFSLRGPRYLFKRFTDADAATARELKHLAPGEDLPNRWQMRSTLVGLITWTLTLLLPEKKETKEDVEKMTELYVNDTIGYVFERLRQAVWIPEWSSHKRQLLGLGMMIGGICSTMGGLRNRDATVLNGEKYVTNISHVITGLIHFCSSIPLLFALDNDRGYSLFGGIHMQRAWFLVPSILKKFSIKEPGAGWYTAGAIGFHAENVSTMLMGGVEKLDDGTVVDKEAMRKEAKQHAMEKKYHLNEPQPASNPTLPKLQLAPVAAAPHTQEKRVAAPLSSVAEAHMPPQVP